PERFLPIFSRPISGWQNLERKNHCDKRVTGMTYDFAKPEDLPAVASLLALCKLPANDLEAHDFLVAMDKQRIVGCLGIEREGAVLRSLAVDPQSRGQRIGKELCSRLLKHAKEKGIQETYLLTDSAERFFEKFGFEKV